MLSVKEYLIIEFLSRNKSYPKTKLEILSHERNGKLSGYHFDYFSKSLIENIKKLNKIED